MNVLVVGATSAIAEAAARIWAARGDAVYLAARREPLLEACAARASSPTSASMPPTARPTRR